MNEYIASASDMLARNAYCDIVLLSSTAGSFINGRAYDDECSRQLSEAIGAQVLTSAMCLLRALETLGTGEITLVTPSSSALNEAETAFMRGCGITVMAEGGVIYFKSEGYPVSFPEKGLRSCAEK